MKNNKIYIAGLMLFMLMISCRKEFLDRQPKSQLSEDSFFKNKNDAINALAACYNYLSRGANAVSASGVFPGFGAGYMSWDVLSDNAWTQSGSGNLQPVLGGTQDATTSGIIPDTYTTYYQAINTCNQYLVNIGGVKDLTTSELNNYKADVRFLRAYHYFMLSELFGDCVLTTKPLGNNETDNKLPRVAKSIVVDTILADLDFAINNLPNTAYSGRVIKGTAQGYKVKVLSANGRYPEAAAVAKEIIDANIFRLSPDYNSLFLKPGQNGNPEIMFSARYLPPSFSSPQDWALSLTNFVQPSANLVNEYEMNNGKMINETGSGFLASAPYVNRDPRLKNTIIVPGDLRGTATSSVFTPAAAGISGGFLPRKGVNAQLFPTTYATVSDQDWVLLRFAEILLLYAEGQNESTGPDASVYDAVNKVRARVGMPSLPTGLTQTEMRNRIRHERRVELALEGLRFFDLKRWNLSATIIPTVVDPNNARRTFPARAVLWPIPQTEIDKAKGLGNSQFKQNIGY